MKHIGIIPNRLKDVKLNCTKQIINKLNQYDIVPYIIQELEEMVHGQVKGVTIDTFYNECECIIVIGGDGTILEVASIASLKGIPIVGVNLGRLGFLTDIEPTELDEALYKLIHHQFQIEERMMLQATIKNKLGEQFVFYALNEINVTRGNFSRLVEFEITINGDLSSVYPADGIIVATPTGSTAYNLSAGGPIIVPLAKTYVITPICPHTLYSKSIILCKEDKVCIRTLETTKDTALSMDGKLKMYITSQDTVHIQCAPYVTKLLKLSGRPFFKILSEKIGDRNR